MKRFTIILTVLILLATAYYSGAQQEQPSDLQQAWEEIKGRTGTFDSERSWALFIVHDRFGC
jgi:hypothetical protein